jgi:4-hydroxybenzoate polyprenyltransferase
MTIFSTFTHFLSNKWQTIFNHLQKRKEISNNSITSRNDIYYNKKQPKLCNYNGNNNNNDDNDNNDNIVNQYLKTLIFYVKARSNVYIFAFATLISLIIGSRSFANLNLIAATSAVIASYFMALATYIYNDLTDFELDKINKTNRPFITGKATEKQLVVIVYLLNSIALLLTAFVNFYALFVSISFIALGITYSHPKFNLKDKFPLKTVVTAAGAGLLSLLGGEEASSSAAPTNNIIMSLPIIYAALSFFAFFFILGPLGDIGDLKGDKTVGRRTFPIVLGIMPTIIMMLSIPVIIILMTTMLFYYYCYCYYYYYYCYNSIDNSSSSNTSIIIITGIHHINVSGIYLIVGTCLATFTFILRISKKVNDVSAIKSMRPKMRFLHIMLQVSLLLVFI